MLNDSLTMTRAGEAERTFIARVYGWMCIGLAITAVVALYVATSVEIRMIILGDKLVFYGLIFGELGLVIAITAGINKLSAGVATGLFVIYAAVSGATLSFIFLVYTTGSIGGTFFITSATFGVLAVYGTITKTDLTSVGNLCFMLLIGLIIATVVNMFMRSTMLYWITTYAGVAIFVGLTAYDAQKIKNMSPAAAKSDAETMQKTAIIGALALYLDFINLFLYLLRLFGRRR